MATAGPKPTRPDDDTLRLAKRLADELFSSPALAGGQALRVEIKLTPGSGSVSFTEPERRDLRDLLGLIRKFDMPTHDARMCRLYEIVERVGVKPEWREGLDHAKAAYEARDEIRELRVQDPDGPPTTNPTFIRPRAAFALWAYGEVIHDDYAKQVRWEKLDPMGRGLVRQMAHDYLMGLLEQAAFIRRVITHGLVKQVVDPAS